MNHRCAHHANHYGYGDPTVNELQYIYINCPHKPFNKHSFVTYLYFEVHHNCKKKGDGRSLALAGGHHLLIW